MRVALTHIRHARTGGTERYLNQLAAYLAEAGHDVTILCRKRDESPHPRVRFDVLHNLALGPAWRLHAFARAVERRVRESEFDVVYGLGRTWTQDVIRLGGGCHQTYLDRAHDARSAGRRRAVPGLKHRVTLRIEERALAPGACERIVTNSEMVRDDVIERFAVPEEAIEVIYNGVDLERFHPRTRTGAGAELREALGFGGDELVVLFLGSGYGRKGLDLVLSAFPELVCEHPEARLVVVGYDSARSFYEAQAKKGGLGEEVVFAGGRSDAERWYAAADVYVLPTRYDPFANSTLEALASGMPVVTTRTNGGAELIEHHVQGSVIDVGDGPASLQAELEFWSDAPVRRAGASAARALAEEHGHDSKMERAEAVLEEVARRRASGPRSRR